MIHECACGTDILDSFPLIELMKVESKGVYNYEPCLRKAKEKIISSNQVVTSSAVHQYTLFIWVFQTSLSFVE